MANQKSSSKAVALPAEISGAIDRLRERWLAAK
jgi:hypothetical protein